MSGMSSQQKSHTVSGHVGGGISGPRSLLGREGECFQGVCPGRCLCPGGHYVQVGWVTSTPIPQDTVGNPIGMLTILDSR